MKRKRESRPNGIQALAAILAGAILCSPLAADQDPQSCVRAKPGLRLGKAIGLEYGPDLPLEIVEEAIAYWRSCEGYAGGFPAFANEGTVTRTVKIRMVAGSSGSSKCGSFQGRDIVIYALASDARGRIRPCGSPARLLAHELGHVLGLSDCPAKRECRRALMSEARPGAAQPPEVTKAECDAVNEHWLTPREAAERVAMAAQPASGGTGDSADPRTRESAEPMVIADNLQISAGASEPPPPV